MQLSFGRHLKNLLSKQDRLPADSPFNKYIDDVVRVTGQILQDVQKSQQAPATAPVQAPVQKPAPGPLANTSTGTPAAKSPADQEEPEVTTEAKDAYSGATPNKDYIMNVNEAYLTAALELYTKHHPDQAEKIAGFMDFVASLDNKTTIAQEPSVKKATTAAIKGIQLNTKGEIGKLDADVEAVAMNFAKKFSVKPIWARNLVGMFSIAVPAADRVKFLKACEAGHALDMKQMIEQGQGSIDSIVTTKVPGIKKVFSSVKETLLDISLSTGQRGATGPFEAVLAIMGGARKPRAEEGGDVVVEIDGKATKLEVKAGSMTPTSKLLKDGSLPSTGAINEAWLDSTAGKEVSGSTLRIEGDDWLSQNWPTFHKNKNVHELWNKSDFRSTSLIYFSEFLTALDKAKPQGSAKLISYMMSRMFPTAVNAPGFNYSNSIKKIIAGIHAKNPNIIAKEQGIMALIEYCLGKGNDGFVFFNSSTQEYKMVMGMKGILALANVSDDPEVSDVRFTQPMTMKRGAAKCSPGIYFGPLASSQRAKEYFAMFNSDPERVAMRKAAWEAEQKAKQAQTQPELDFNPKAKPKAMAKTAPSTAPREKRTVASSPIRQRR